VLSPQRAKYLLRQVGFPQYPRSYSIVDIVINVSYPIRDTYDFTLRRIRFFIAGMAKNTVFYLIRQVQPQPGRFQPVQNPETLFIMLESTFVTQNHVERVFPRMAERCVSKVMPERYGFGKVFIKPKPSGDSPADSRDLKRVC
jgi:hypothetical protein